MYLIVVDAYSKWPEVIGMSSSTSTSETIKLLLSLFSSHGLPDKLVGPQLTSDEFKDFMTNCGILYIKTAPYHAQTNGEAERFVHIFNPLVPSAGNMRRNAKILILILEGIIKKIFYERRDYESVHEKKLILV